MRSLSSSDLLEVWEAGAGLHSLDRGLVALSAVFPEVPSANLADWTLGRRNQALIELHCSLFGSDLEGWMACTLCGEKMEFKINARALIGDSPDGVNREQTVFFKGQSFRLPSSRDLAAAAQQKEVEAAAVCLMERCRTNADGPVHWTGEDIEQLGEKMAAADPLAEIRLALRCPSCGDQSTETIEIMSFLWAEIQVWVKQLLWEVHEIASAYGWTESQVLSLSPARRALYLEMVHA